MKFISGTRDRRSNKGINRLFLDTNVGATASALRGAYLTWNLASVRRNTLGSRLGKPVVRTCGVTSDRGLFVEFLKELSGDGVALTGGAFEALGIKDMDMASLILDQAAALQDSRHQGHG